MRLCINIFLIILSLLTSCSSSSLQDLQKESQKTIQTLTQDLKSIHNREDLLKKRAILRKHFDHIAELMIEADRLNGEIEDEGEDDSCDLLNEMVRIYKLDGAKELMENYQKDARRALAKKGIIY